MYYWTRVERTLALSTHFGRGDVTVGFEGDWELRFCGEELELLGMVPLGNIDIKKTQV